MGEQSSDPPGAVSDQNREEQQSGMRSDEAHPEPRARDEDVRPDRGSERGREAAEGEDDTGGESKEGSQSTGHPRNAG
jgi:hypothetical protein